LQAPKLIIVAKIDWPVPRKGWRYCPDKVERFESPVVLPAVIITIGPPTFCVYGVFGSIYESEARR
jgi:hypothetical protein